MLSQFLKLSKQPHANSTILSIAQMVVMVLTLPTTVSFTSAYITSSYILLEVWINNCNSYGAETLLKVADRLVDTLSTVAMKANP